MVSANRRTGLACCNTVYTKYGRKKDVAQLPLAEHDDIVKVFAPDGASQPFRVPILPGPWRNWPVMNAHGPKPPSKNPALGREQIFETLARRDGPFDWAKRVALVIRDECNARYVLNLKMIQGPLHVFL
jgi:hypothetical protein